MEMRKDHRKVKPICIDDRRGIVNWIRIMNLNGREKSFAVIFTGLVKTLHISRGIKSDQLKMNLPIFFFNQRTKESMPRRYIPLVKDAKERVPD